MQIKELLAEVLEVSPDEISDDFGPQNHPNWDSLRHVEVILALEERYNVRFSVAEVISIDSFARIREILASKGIEVE